MQDRAEGMSRPGWLLLAGAVACAALLAVPMLRLYWRVRETNPVRRGAIIAARAGCWSCHGANGTRGLPDPGLGEEVPAWDGGVAMMYVDGPGEVREYILDGTTARRQRSESAQRERTEAAIRMPAYRSRLRTRQVDDLVAYVVAVAGLVPPRDPQAARGRELVVKFRCEACHGVGGSGGVDNPGSFKGYVPGWLGPDFKELVRTRDEVSAWIESGRIERFESDPLARFFLRRQRLSMPAYKAALAPGDTAAIAAYIDSLRSGGG